MATTKLSTDVIDLSSNTEALTIPSGNTGPDTTDTTGTCNYPTTATALYQFSSDATDTCGNYNGTNDSGIVYTTPGKFGNGAQFGGGSDRIDIDQALLGSGTTKIWSTSFWFNTSSATEQYMNNTAAYSSGKGYSVYIRSNGYLQFSTSDGGGGNSEKGWRYEVATVNDGNWHNVVATYSSAGGTNDAYLYLYLDGVDVTSASTAINGMANGSGPTYSSFTTPRISLGNWADSSAYPSGLAQFIGSMDQVRFFDVALTANQVTALATETNVTSIGGRPSSPTEGLMRENETTGKMEFYDGSLWQEITDTASTYSTIVIPAANFNTVTYTGDGSSLRSIAGTGFAPDFTWTKKRGPSTANHLLQNTVNGAGTGSALYSAGNYAAGAYDIYGYISSFDADGVTYQAGTNASYPTDLANENGSTYVSWRWKAGGAATTINAGTVSNDVASDVSANTATGFSIVKYTGTLGAAGNIDVAHGLGAAPEIIISKRTDSTGPWRVRPFFLNSNPYNYLELDTSGAIASLNVSDGTMAMPTSTVFSNNWNTGLGGIGDVIAYCWRSIPGYSKIGFYVGNGSTTGPTIYTGFKPAWIMIKYTNSTGSWYMYDNKRSTTNPWNDILQANESVIEDTNATYSDLNYLDNGFQLKTTNAEFNGSRSTYIYMTFAE